MWKKIFKRFGKPLYPELTNSGKIGRALVVSPHPDDDVMGAGGTLHLIRDRVWIVHVTDGGLGIPGVLPENARQVRQTEARQAAIALCIPEDRLRFLGFHDQEIGKTDHVSNRIAEVLADIRPEDIFLPSPLDNHPDHRHTALAAAGALETNRTSASCWVYEVWTPFYPNRIVDISGVVEIKKRAIEAHYSQVSVIDYVEKVTGLNSFRSMTAKGVRFAEAFYKCSPRTYIEMVRTLTD